MRVMVLAVTIASISTSCKGKTEVRDNPETANKLKACELTLKDKSDYIASLEKKNADLGQLWLEDGKPMLFGDMKKGGTKGLKLNLDHLHLEVVDVVDGDWEAAGILVHDVRNRAVAHMLVEMPFGLFPMALGVLYDDPAPTFDSVVVEQNATVAKGKVADLQKLVSKGQTWTVGKQPEHA